MIVDYHLHTIYSRHARGTIAEYLARAEAADIDEVCFTEHTSRQYVQGPIRAQIPGQWMREHELPCYLDQVKEAGLATELRVRRGLEVDYFEGFERPLQEFLAAWPLDFVLGTVHFLPAYGMEYVGSIEDDPGTVMVEYYRYAQRGVETGLFDSMAHLHLPWQLLPWPRGEKGRQVLAALAGVVAAARAQDMCLEINTRAFNYEGYGTPELYRRFMGLVADHNVLITMGSDAHAPEEVGRNFAIACKELRRYGIKEVAVFDRRERELVPLGTHSVLSTGF